MNFTLRITDNLSGKITAIQKSILRHTMHNQLLPFDERYEALKQFIKITKK